MLKKIWLSRLHSGELSDSLDSCSTQSDPDHPESPVFVQAVPSTTMQPNTMTTSTESSMSRAPPLMSSHHTTEGRRTPEYSAPINYSRYSPPQHHHLVSMPPYHRSHPLQQRPSTSSSTSSTPPLQHLQDLSSYPSMPSPPSSAQGRLEGHLYIDPHRTPHSSRRLQSDSHMLHSAGHSSSQDEPLNLVCTLSCSKVWVLKEKGFVVLLASVNNAM